MIASSVFADARVEPESSSVERSDIETISTLTPEQ
jgi:hypothetical protein